MGRKWIWIGIFLMGMAAAAGPLTASAGGYPLASPTPRPTQRVTAPVISGVNPEVIQSEGEQGDITPSDVFSPKPLRVLDGLAPPAFVEPESLSLAVPFQAQGDADVNCGPASLAMALNYLNRKGGTKAISANQLGSWLASRGLLYEWGTGVEELALAARSFGFEGSVPYKGWSLDLLVKEIESGRPVVVALGSNGADQPGHFLTLTGISPDGQWITCLDPQRGNIRLSREEFISQWDLQGRSGVQLRRGALPLAEDSSLPWMGLLSAVSALVLTQGFLGDNR